MDIRIYPNFFQALKQLLRGFLFGTIFSVGGYYLKHTIMTNLIIISYPTPVQATAGARKLAEIETLGDITIYDSVLIRKNEQNEIHVLEQDASAGSDTLAGMAIGGLIGALAGPIGLISGLLLGTLGGIAYETDKYSFSESFAKKVAETLKPGDAALIAEVAEDDYVYITSYASETGGILIRTDADEAYQLFDDAQLIAMDEEIAAERKRLKKAVDEEKAAILREIEVLKEKRKNHMENLKVEAEKRMKDGVVESRAEFLQRRIDAYKERVGRLEDELRKLRG